MRPSLGAIVCAALLASAAGAAPYRPPRAADGRPDLTGVWTNASITRLTRPPGATKLVVSDAEAEAIARANPLVEQAQAEAAPAPAADRPPPAGETGGYNAFWLDPGRTLATVKGERRTSWIVDPVDGQLPLSAEGRRRIAASRSAHEPDAPSGPEALMPWDRCLIGSRGSGGPGMLNNIYNSNYQIVQTPSSIAIDVEMIHDVRTIPIFAGKAAAQAGHAPAALHPWLGDSTAWWEGDTLVVETVHVNPEEGRSGPVFLSDRGRVTERFTRVSDRQILYGFTVDDPGYYTRPWRAELVLNAGPAQLYEYACHEGNYALPDILAGARASQARR
jgi:hypothetical protein